ncbi:hypothetical protein CLOSTHATH_05138, partial [Hungatella hathewayi DSM 13479]
MYDWLYLLLVDFWLSPFYNCLTGCHRNTKERGIINMTYEELKTFTWEELSALTYYQLKMDKYELLVKAQN